MSPTQGSRCASTLGYGRFPLQGMAWADVGLCSSRDVLRSNADGVPVQADGLPIGAGVCRGMSSGADTEVRPPATRVLGPLGALWGGARIGLCYTPTNHPALSPSPQPSPTVTRVRLLESRLVGEGATRGGAAGLAADLLHQPTRGRWGLGRPQARRGGYHADHQATWIGQPRCVPNQRHSPARAPTQGGGGADLCVRSAGCSSGGNRCDGQP